MKKGLDRAHKEAGSLYKNEHGRKSFIIIKKGVGGRIEVGREKGGWLDPRSSSKAAVEKVRMPLRCL